MIRACSTSSMFCVQVRIIPSLYISLPQPLLSHRHGCSPSPPLARGAEGNRRLPHLPLPDASAWGRCAAGRFNEPPRQSHDVGLLPWTQLSLQVLGFVPPGRAQHCLLDGGTEDLGGRWDKAFNSKYHCIKKKLIWSCNTVSFMHLGWFVNCISF